MIAVEILLLLIVVSGRYVDEQERAASSLGIEIQKEEGKDFIRWVEFNADCESMELALEYDMQAHEQGKELSWIKLLAYAAAKNGGEFGKSAQKDIRKMGEKVLKSKADLDKEGEELKYYPYFCEAYQAVLGGMVGEYQIEETDEKGNRVWKNCYGLKAFSPIAKGFPYSDYDDFGASRSYGYNRPHLGHDMAGSVGTPIIAIESGYVEALGWNQYGGWRIGIRSFDKKRYYYYAHLRQNYPYATGLKEGDIVTAGQVIGYMGHTGYSEIENVNNIENVHLHWGMELIFDESQKESDNEIWIDCYELTRFLYRNRSETRKVEGTKDWERVTQMKDPAVTDYQKRRHNLTA